MPIYLDSNATSQIDPEVIEAMLPFLREHYANPSSAYRMAKPARDAVATARREVAAMLGADPDEIVFTSCGTESNNTAIASALALYPEKRHVITTAAEHDAVLAPCQALEEHGLEVTYLGVNEGGLIDLEELRAALRPGETALVSILWANNETGVIAPVAEAAAIAHEAGALVHTDAVQAFGKIPVSVTEADVDMLSLSGHKFHAPKGVGVLYLSSRVRFEPQLLGGGQESGRRSGTENVAGIVALGTAARLMGEHDEAEVQALRDQFENGLRTRVPDYEINGDPAHRLPTTSSLYFPGIDAAGLLLLLDDEDVCASAGSACHTSALHSSHVLAAMGFDRRRASGTMRFSFSRFNVSEEVEQAVEIIASKVEKMRSLRTSGPIRRA